MSVKTAESIAVLCAAHRRKRLVEVAGAMGQRLTPAQLRDHAHAEGLEPTLKECRSVEDELYPQLVQRPLSPSFAAVLEAARRLPQPFSLSELVVMTWRGDQEGFSLTGFTQFPSEQKVRCTLWGPRGLVTRGYLVRDGKLFRVKEAS